MSPILPFLVLVIWISSFCTTLPLPPPPLTSISNRIVGGQRVRIDQVPYQVLIRQQHAGQIFQCGAVLIDAEWLLTASHCIQYDATDGQPRPIEAHFGMSRLSQIPRQQGRNLAPALPRLFAPSRGRLPLENLFVLQFPSGLNRMQEMPLPDVPSTLQSNPAILTRSVVAVFKPPPLPPQPPNHLDRQAHGPTVDSVHQFVDLALLKLNSSVPITDRIRPIQLPSQGEQFAERVAYASGFGATAFVDNGPSSPSNTLHAVSIPILTKSVCLRMYRSAFEDAEAASNFVRPQSVLCAGLIDGGRDSCVGDSGGPLSVCDSTKAELRAFKGNHECPEGAWKLAGIISIGYKCGEPGIPGLYTDVGLFADWIRRTMEQNRGPAVVNSTRRRGQSPPTI